MNYSLNKHWKLHVLGEIRQIQPHRRNTSRPDKRVIFLSFILFSIQELQFIPQMRAISFVHFLCPILANFIQRVDLSDRRGAIGKKTQNKTHSPFHTRRLIFCVYSTCNGCKMAGIKRCYYSVISVLTLWVPPHSLRLRITMFPLFKINLILSCSNVLAFCRHVSF